MLRLVGRLPKYKLDKKSSNQHYTREITAAEYNVAWQFLIHHEQQQRLEKEKYSRLFLKLKSSYLA